jgi:DNA invertase Pin-like site-specific DNA recombinase
MSNEPRPVRCAIYTRKSTEDGLEQEFNSLQAQREAAEAYIISRREAGWVAVPEPYDDGGFSGASLERPALRKLLSDVEGGKIDCVLVYKVDRLSRSLLDFARLIELFEKLGVSFVSVTQDFNSTSSLGRLTLHILLSFAQFEREIIGERTRDKLGAARRKGKWIGGAPMLGYDVDPHGRGLVVNASEAEQVRAIFDIAAAAGSLEATLNEVQAGGFFTKHWTSKAGRDHPGKPFSKDALRRLLSSVLYTGDVSYKGLVYAGEHAALVDAELWQRVNHRFNMRTRQRACERRQPPLLARLLDCAHCHGSMLAAHSVRAGQRYEYYFCALARKSKRTVCRQRAVAAIDLHGSLAHHLDPLLGSEPSEPMIQQSLERVVYDSDTRRVVVKWADGTRSEYRLAEAIRPGVRSANRATAKGRIPRISRLMALAIKMDRLLRERQVRSYSELARLGHVSRARMSQILRLTELAPAIQEELLWLPRTAAGKDRVSESALRRVASTIDWELQRMQFQALMGSTDSL